MPKTSIMPKMNRFVALEKSLETAQDSAAYRFCQSLNTLGFVDGHLSSFRSNLKEGKKLVRPCFAFSVHSQDKVSGTDFVIA